MSKRVGHAYLFTGARGVGKTSTARIFAKSLNCVNGPTLTPCGECDSCQSVSVGEDIDVIEIDGASNRGIDEIRQLRQNASICPSRSHYKIYIIDEVHMLTREAFNALLKTLEEPPKHVKFIFCTTEAAKIPITILSRCQRFDFAGIETNAIADRLALIAKDEKITTENGVFEILARRAAGSMRDAQSLLEQLLSFAPEHIKLSDVHEMLGSANDQLIFRIIDAMIQSDAVAIFSELDTAVSEGVDVGVLLEQLLGLLRDMLVTVSGGHDKLLIFCMPPQFEQVKTVADAFGIHRIIAAMQILDHTASKMRYSTQGRVLLELALVRIAHLDQVMMIGDLLEQLKAGQTPSLPQTITPVQRAIAPPKTVEAADAMTNMTPQQRFAASNVIADVDLASMTDAKATEVWRHVAEMTQGMVGQYAGHFKLVEFKSPNLFIVTFNQKLTKDFCERESPKLQNTLCQLVGKSVRVQFFCDETPANGGAKEASSEHLPVSRADLSVKRREAVENPLVKKLEELFGAELCDVK